jgi:predicted Rossmann fold nucleotide-binding protein DprA/Smf involved in DNA uptake
MNLIQAQKEWDDATNAYSRRPNADNWHRFLECKRIVLALKNPVVRDLRTPEKKADDKIYDFLLSLYPQIIESKKIMTECGITKDQMRHGLLKLLDQGKIEKIKTGYYQSKLGKKI